MATAKDKKSPRADYCFYPIHHSTLHEIYRKQQDMLWGPTDIDFNSDRADWYSLDRNVKEFIKQILGFFACADGIVNENIMENFRSDTKFIKEASAFYAVQSYIETVHAEVYSLFIDTFITDTDPEKEMLFNSVETMPFVKNIADWMFKWMDRSVSLLARIVAFACVEGIFFCSAFAAIYWIKSKNILNGLTKANEWIARDESLHVEFAVRLFKVIRATKDITLSENEVHNIIKEAVGVAEEFTKNSLGVDLIGLDAVRLIEYIKTTADSLCVSLGFDKIYKCNHSLDWMMSIGLDNKSNFFETRVSEYSVITGTIEFD